MLCTTLFWLHKPFVVLDIFEGWELQIIAMLMILRLPCKIHMGFIFYLYVIILSSIILAIKILMFSTQLYVGNL